jgi:hypothetical protein
MQYSAEKSRFSEKNYNMQYAHVLIVIRTPCQSVFTNCLTVNLFHVYQCADYSGRAAEDVGPGRLYTAIVSKNPAQDMNVCPRLSALCCTVEVEALSPADPHPGSPNKCGTDSKFQK